MKRTNRHIANRLSNSHIAWLLLSLLLLCLTACSTGGYYDTDEAVMAEAPEDEPAGKEAKLYVYIYQPNTEVPTRSYTGDVDAITHEATIYQLQIWVFTHTSHELIGYFSSTESSALNTGDGYEVFQMTIDETFAEAPEASREHVDVYVLANVKNSNCSQTFDQETTQNALEAALIEKSTADPFGVTAPVTAVPANAGLPMSGVLRNVPVSGTAPVLRLDNSGQIAKVTLVRAVSKLRFAFSSMTGGETLRINSIKLNSEMIPVAEYLFMAEGAPYDRQTCHLKTASGYDATIPDLLSEAISEVATNDDPTAYAWGNEEQEPQAYEHMLDMAATNGDITQRLFFLRESDKQLQGEIKYQIGDGAEQTATFRMADANGFSRNHIWTVYAYLAYAHLQVVVAEVAPWKITEQDYEFYNW